MGNNNGKKDHAPSGQAHVLADAERLKRAGDLLLGEVSGLIEAGATLPYALGYVGGHFGLPHPAVEILRELVIEHLVIRPAIDEDKTDG